MTNTYPSFKQHYVSSFTNMLRWHQLDELWKNVKNNAEGWYIYLIGDTVPDTAVTSEELYQFIQEIDELLHREHDYDYCGIVYADNKESPLMIKIFDPSNLGSACGCSGQVIPPRWLLTRIPPEAIIDDTIIPANRIRWWQRLFRR